MAEQIMAVVGIGLALLRVLESALIVFKREKELTLVKGIIQTIVEVFRLG